MKKTISLLLAALMLLSLTVFTFAQQKTNEIAVNAGQQARVTVAVAEEVSGLTVAELRLQYDEELFSYDKEASRVCEEPEDPGAEGWFLPDSAIGGKEKLAGIQRVTYANMQTSGGTLAAGQKLAVLVFTAKKDMTAEQAASFAASVYSAMDVKGSSLTKAIELTADISTGEIVPGDVNGDGVITTTDADLIISHIRDITPITDEKMLEAADVSGDGKITMFDVALIMSKMRNVE